MSLQAIVDYAGGWSLSGAAGRNASADFDTRYEIHQNP